jgi:hypothetical protein
MVYWIDSLGKIYYSRNCCHAPNVRGGKQSSNILWPYWATLIFVKVCWLLLNTMLIFRNLVISSTILVLLRFTTWFMPNCYLWSRFNVYSFLHETFFTLAQLQCLHLTQDISTKNGHSGNITKYCPKDPKCYDFCEFICHHFP